VALLATGVNGADWTVFANVGESFGALNAVISGLALAAVVVTFWMQFAELKAQRAELASQRESLVRSHADVYRATETDVRRLHMELIKFALKDPALARVWPIGQADLSPERTRQYLYVNLVLQHLALQARIGTVADIERQVRRVFCSPVVREYWRDTAADRKKMVDPGSAEQRFSELATKVCDEYESVLLEARRRSSEGPYHGPVDEPMREAA
jgi:hypothetical protein